MLREAGDHGAETGAETEEIAGSGTAAEEAVKPPLLIVTGPTAVGKTAVSVQLAKAVGGEIISADSMQVYRHMDIGSAKVRPEEMEGVPHHLIDVLEPTEDFSAAVFQQMAREALKGIYGRGRVPIVAGGTGFYIQALLYDIDFAQEERDAGFRRRLEELAEREGPEKLHRILSGIDPQSAREIHPNNIRRTIRAIEFYRQTGQPISLHNRLQRVRPSPYRFYYYVLNTDRQDLYERIDRRVDLMIRQGLVDEVRALAAMGCRRDMVSMQGLGYKEILDYLEGKCSLEETVRIIKRDTRHFAKRQITWFKRERDVRWLNLADYGGRPERIVRRIMEDLRADGAKRAQAGTAPAEP